MNWPDSWDVSAFMTERRQRLGESGENDACHELAERGYAILARRYRTRHGEIDIVARDGDTIVFVEVRVKTSAEFGSAAESVAPWKQRRVAAMAADYLARNRITDRPCRFDVVAIDCKADGSRELRLIRHAFDAN
jgi:putative endonuclease